MPYKLVARVRRSGILLGFAAMLWFSAAASAASQHLGDRVLGPGMRGHDVRVLQDFLTRAGFPTQVVGFFGAQTERSVLAFQRRFHLRADGVLSHADANKLRAVVARDTAGPQPSAPANTNQNAVEAGTGPSGGAAFVPGPNSAPVERATLNARGLAVPPSDAPEMIRQIIAAANQIAFKPYIYGGGHGSFYDSGYDCSGSVSYALHGGGLLKSPLDSTEFETWGRSGAGRWITLWANGGHVFMYIAGLRFDTAAQSSSNGNDRWSAQRTSSAGFIEVHPSGW
ncbi:MAG: peptidoglycan-binding domain-containing protein [Solirubrobacteraceae bacterium]